MSKPSARIGQHLFIGLAGTELTPATRRLLNTVQPGGIVLFARNVENAGQLRAFCRALQTEFPFRPLVAIDQEHGRVNRLREITGELPTIPQLKAAGATETVEDFGRTIGRWLHQLRIDINFAPVLDLELFDDKTDNALRERCWGRTAAEVIRWAGAFLDGMEREGVTACPKHFPGLGAATLDSHEALPTIARDIAEDLKPYRQFMKRLTMIMIGHAVYPAFDEKPASLARVIMTDLLRRQLGFTGLAITDDMEMGAITDFENAVVEAFLAGADMILVCHSADKALAAYEALSKAQLPAARLAESRQRIQQFHDEWIGHKD
jgi:beta-N-acetylhexosaminidase